MLQERTKRRNQTSVRGLPVPLLALSASTTRPTPALEFHGNRTPDLSYLRRWSNHSATSAVISPSLKKCKRDTCVVNDRAYALPKRNHSTSSLTLPPYPHMKERVINLFTSTNSRRQCTLIKWGISHKVYFFPGEPIEYQTHYLQHT